MRDDILSMDDFGSVMSRLQRVPPGIQVRHLIARAKAMAATSLLDTSDSRLASPAASAARGKDRLVVPRLRSKSRGDADAPAATDVDDDKKRAIKDAWASESPLVQNDINITRDVSASPTLVDGFEKVSLTVPRPASAMTKSNDADVEDVDPFTTSMFATTNKSAGQLLRDTSLKLDAALAAKARKSSPDAAARARADAIHHLSLALASFREASTLGDAVALDAAARTQNVIDVCESPQQ